VPTTVEAKGTIFSGGMPAHKATTSQTKGLRDIHNNTEIADIAYLLDMTNMH